MLPQRQSLPPLRRAALILAAGALSLVTLLVGPGCGSGKKSGSSGASGIGRAVLNIVWPDASRHVPFAAQRIRIQVTDADTNDCYFGEGCRGPAFTLDYPQTELTLSPLPVRRNLLLKLEALGQDGVSAGVPVFSPVPLASQTLPLEKPLNPDETAEILKVTLVQTVEKLRVYSGSTLLSDGSSVLQPLRFKPTDPSVKKAQVALRVEALDKDGRTVLLKRPNPPLPLQPTNNSDLKWDNENAKFIELRSTIPNQPSKLGSEQLVGRIVNIQNARTGTLTVNYTGVNNNTSFTEKVISATITVVIGQETEPGLQTTSLVLDNVSSGNDQFDVAADESEAALLVNRAGVSTVATLNSARRFTLPGYAPSTRLATMNPIAQQSDPFGHLPLIIGHPEEFGPLVPIITDNSFDAFGNVISSEGSFVGSAFHSSTTFDIDHQTVIRTSVNSNVGSGRLFILDDDAVTVYDITKQKSFPPLLSNSPVTVSAASGFTNLAVDDAGSLLRVYRASSNTVRKDAGTTALTGDNLNLNLSTAQPYTNPSGETLETIEDIAAESSYLYVLSTKYDNQIPPKPILRRVHIFNDEGQWLYSVKPDPGVEAAVNGADTVRIAAGRVDDGSGRLFLAYRSGTTAAVLQYFRPKDE